MTLGLCQLWKGGKGKYLLLNLKTCFNIKVYHIRDSSIQCPRLGSSVNSGWRKYNAANFFLLFHSSFALCNRRNGRNGKSLDPLHSVHFPFSAFNCAFRYLRLFSNLKSIVLSAWPTIWLHPEPLPNLMAARNKMFYSLEIAMFGKHYYCPPKQFKDFGGNKPFYFEELRINDLKYPILKR